MTTLGATTVTMGFMPASEAIPDPDHPGLLRAGPRASGPYGRESVELHRCEATDGSLDASVAPDLLELGFDVVDLTPLDDLQAVLARVAAAGRIADEDATAIRAALSDATLTCSSSVTAQVLHIADEGLILRTSGPNGLDLVGPRSHGMNDHGAATSVHADQDVFGTPLEQLMAGRAPRLFRHDSPDGSNHEATLMLANLWIPLQQITQPLVLADGRSVDRRRHQLRYGLATTSFLERDEDQAINDIWTFLHDPGQRWHLRSDMDHRSAYLFNTLSTPHGACTLPGEDVAEQCYLALEDAEAAVAAGDVDALRAAVDRATAVAVPDDAPPALRAAIAQMVAVAGEAADDPAAVCDERASAWTDASAAARRRVVRMSIELRVVVSISA
jgi:hypothetical protein